MKKTKIDPLDPLDYDNEVARAIVVLAQEVGSVAYQLKRLGNGNAATEMGAIENLAAELKQGFSSISGSIESIARRETHEA